MSGLWRRQVRRRAGGGAWWSARGKVGRSSGSGGECREVERVGGECREVERVGVAIFNDGGPVDQGG
ncbi:hypothetical protein DL240_18850 [Lujinxingia litoralis]|uniref:Uncharacterized protein n=1 Tax=Lujinxingia litoralis TaxID=2211119 RepID=A0A328C1B7_9DELT|nr:hypothetical protein DL240_18850 [Lujinxingia litoralis]